MNCIANSPDIAKYYIQQHNIKKRISKGEPTVPPSPLPLSDTSSNPSSDPSQDESG